MARLSILNAALIGIVAGMASPAGAQKNSGPLLPTTPQYAPSRIPPDPYVTAPYARPSYAPPPFAPPSYPSPSTRPVPSVAAPRAGNPDAERLAQTLPLDPQTRELRDQMPADPRGTERRLGLRDPRGPAPDLRGRAPSPREIVDALAPR